MKTYVTFGQSHVHRINGKILDRDCVALINGNRDDVFKMFGDKFCFEYAEDKFNFDSMKYFPRGIIEV